MKFTKILILILVFSLYGCDVIENMSSKNITLTCKGKSTLVDSKFNSVYSENNYITSFYFKKDSNIWSVKRNDNQFIKDNTLEKKNFDSPNYQDISINVQPEFIEIVNFYKLNNLRSEEKIKINRVTGFFKEEKTELDSHGINKDWLYSEGVCEKVTDKKF